MYSTVCIPSSPSGALSLLALMDSVACAEASAIRPRDRPAPSTAAARAEHAPEARGRGPGRTRPVRRAADAESDGEEERRSPRHHVKALMAAGSKPCLLACKVIVATPGRPANPSFPLRFAYIDKHPGQVQKQHFPMPA